MAGILEEFLRVLERDRAKYIKDWLVSWNYQVKRDKTEKKYEEGVTSDFFTYNGPGDLVNWMNWFGKEPFPNYLSGDRVNELLEKSRNTDKAVQAKLGLTYDFTFYDQTIGINNVQDFLIPQMYPVPERNKIKIVVDFGAGFGRQANLWSRECTYIAVDAIPNSYCLQNLYYHALSDGVTDYIESPENFKIVTDKKGIYHLPTWRFDLIPSSSCDAVICIQVLPELNNKLIKWLIGQFHRILKPGGMIYLRDHAQAVKMAASLDYDAYIADNGFSLEFKPHLIDKKDIHGIPRIYRKNDAEVIKSQTKSAEQRRRELITEADYLTGGALKKLKKAVKKG